MSVSLLLLLLTLTVISQECYSYQLRNTSLLRRKRILLSTNMLPIEISTLMICYDEDKDFTRDLIKLIVPAAIPVAAAITSAFSFYKIVDNSTKAQITSIKEQITSIEKQIVNSEKSTTAQITSIKESTKAQIDSIEKHIASTEKLIIAIEKKVESDKQSTVKMIKASKKYRKINYEASVKSK